MSAPASFDALARAYEAFRTGYAGELFDVLFEAGLAAGERVVDVGCGTGLVTEELVRRGCRLSGVDLSEPMLERARARVPQASFLTAAAEALPFSAAAFDAATSAQAFHWFDQPRALAELARVVRPGGLVAIWWKAIVRGDPVRSARDQVARELGLEPTPDVLAGGFPAFDAAPLCERRLRVIPWRIETTVAEFLGYERSRARARAAYGERLEDYFALLARRLGDPAAVLSIGYVQHLYLGRVPRAASG
ncbi:MAG: class I SAM-dependent methyltransferase [Candidatus Baltobacteraceae bacterium]